MVVEEPHVIEIAGMLPVEGGIEFSAKSKMSSMAAMMARCVASLTTPRVTGNIPTFTSGPS